MKRGNTFWLVITSIIAAIVLAACGETATNSNQVKQEEKEAEGEKEYEPVTIETVQGTIKFTEMPQNVVTIDTHPTEIMLALGLEDYIAGTASNPKVVLPEYKEAYSKMTVLSENNHPSKEVFLSVEPDFVYSGWEMAFQENRLGTITELNNRGIHAYIHQSSNIIGPKMEDVYEDIRNIGRIFKVEDRAAQLITSLESAILEVQQKVQTQVETMDEPLRVFIYDSGEDAPFTATQTIFSEMINMAGGKNIFGHIEKNWTTVSWETVVETNPEVIIIMDYGSATVEQKREFLLTHPALENIAAINNNRIYVMPLVDTFEGVRIPATVEKLAEFFYPQSFQ